MNCDIRDKFKDKKRIVIKIGSSSLTHKESGQLNLVRLEKLVRYICDLKNQGKDVILVSSGAIAVGAAKLNLKNKVNTMAKKQACASVGQAQLMMIYERLFSQYNHVAAQILMTKNTVLDNENRKNTENTFRELLKIGAVPIVNENDTVTTYEIKLGDNDTLSAIVAALVNADLLIILSDIEGLYTDDPRKNSEAKLIERVDEIDDTIADMAKNTTGTSIGSGGMATKVTAARIATASGADTVIAKMYDAEVIERILKGENLGTVFTAHKPEDFFLMEYIEKL